MLHFNIGTRKQLPPQIFEQMGHYRHEIFINRLGWGLKSENGLELDEFDGPDAVYVCAKDDEDRVNGVARLLPTTVPYLMEKAFPHLWAGKVLPRHHQIWELSRFAMASYSSYSDTPTYQTSSDSAADLLRRVIVTAKMEGAHTLITVSPVGMERLLRANNFQATRAGKPFLLDGSAIVALQIKID